MLLKGSVRDLGLDRQNSGRQVLRAESSGLKNEFLQPALWGLRRCMCVIGRDLITGTCMFNSRDWNLNTGDGWTPRDKAALVMEGE